MNRDSTATVSAASVAELAAQTEHLHCAFSDAHALRVAAEEEQGKVATRRATLAARLKAITTELQTAQQGAMETAGSGDLDKFTSAAAEVARLEAENALLVRARSWFDCHPGADSHRGLLVATALEKEAQLRFEEARAQHHEASVLLLAGAATAIAGSLKLTGLGEAAEQHSAICQQIGKDLREARRLLRDHDERVAAARAAFQQESSHE